MVTTHIEQADESNFQSQPRAKRETSLIQSIPVSGIVISVYAAPMSAPLFQFNRHKDDIERGVIARSVDAFADYAGHDHTQA